MPTITYRGHRRAGANMGRHGRWIWGQPREVSEEWLEANRDFVLQGGNAFLVSGYTYEAETVDSGNAPDMTWTKGDILGWMEENSVEGASSLSTKKKLLAAIEKHLNPSEESITEAEEAQTTGDE